jgi:hypothetical protein
VDSFFMRAGDVLQAGIVFAGKQLAFGVPAFAAVNLALSVGWIAIVAALSPAYCAQVAAAPREASDDCAPLTLTLPESVEPVESPVV